MKHKLTKEDLQNNPLLSNCKEGDEIDIPETQNLADDETGPPGGIEIPKKPPPVPE